MTILGENEINCKNHRQGSEKMNVVTMKDIHALIKKQKSKTEKPVKANKVRSRQAVCMNLTDDRVAAQLLVTIIGVFDSRQKKGAAFLRRFSKDWIAMSRDEWGENANLGPGQMKNRALPILKKRCSSFLDIEAWRLNPTEPKSIWVSIDLIKMQEEITPWDVYDAFQKPGGIKAKKVTHPYKIKP